MKCAGDIPATKRSDAAYCSTRCLNAAEKARYCATHPEYVKRQRKLVTKLHHMREHGHTDFIDNPLLNPKDRYRVARSLGYRSMLEWHVAQQLLAHGIDPKECYEKVKITYYKPVEQSVA